MSWWQCYPLKIIDAEAYFLQENWVTILIWLGIMINRVLVLQQDATTDLGLVHRELFSIFWFLFVFFGSFWLPKFLLAFLASRLQFWFHSSLVCFLFTVSLHTGVDGWHIRRSWVGATLLLLLKWKTIVRLDWFFHFILQICLFSAQHYLS